MREINGPTFTSTFLLFVFIRSVQALLNSTPQVLACDRRTVAQGLFRGAKFYRF